MQRNVVSVIDHSLATAIERLVAADGSGAHRALHALTLPSAATRDLADALHLICMLHGNHPGVIDRALDHGATALARDWLHDAADSFAAERTRMANLIAAAGPLPSTPGQAETEAAVLAQRHALDMLGLSDRAGCALGASIALALDWVAIGGFLTIAGDRLGAAPPEFAFPDLAKTRRAIAHAAGQPAVERAIQFGAQQILAQHRGLWDLIEARAHARTHD